jgi:hypothetical protein
MLSRICGWSLLALVGLAQGCGQSATSSAPLFAEPNVHDLQSSFGAQDVVILIRGRAGDAQTLQLQQEILTGTQVVTLRGDAVTLETSEVATALGTELHFRPNGWSTTAWHKLRIKLPSVGRIEGGIQAGGFYTARFISASYLTVAAVSICGQGKTILGDGVTVAFSEAVQQPALAEVQVYQDGVARPCSVVDTAEVTSSASWALACQQMDWSQELEVRAEPIVAGKALRDLSGELGYTIKIKLPLGYANQEKWCYDVAQPDPPL